MMATRLMARLALHELDLVLSDSPANPKLGFRTFNHLLGECDVMICGTEKLTRMYRKGFPQSLEGAPFLLPGDNSAMRRSLEQWFDSLEIPPRIRGEFADSALLKAFGQLGDGVFAVPSIIEADVRRMYRVEVIGHVPQLRERYYAVSVEKKLKHPAVLAISEAARTLIFR